MPGSNRAVFLDRDGTLVEDPGYLTKPEQLKLLDGTADAIARLREAGFLVILATNQSAIARGEMTEQELATVHERLEAMLAEANPDARLDAIYYCPYHPEAAVPSYRQESYLRKPRPGMLFKAAREHQLDLAACWMVGDSERDVQAGKTAGSQAIRIDPDPETETMADRVLSSLADAADAILAPPKPTAARKTRRKKAKKRKALQAATASDEVLPAEKDAGTPASEGEAAVEPGGSSPDADEVERPEAEPQVTRAARPLGATRKRLLREIEQERRQQEDAEAEPAAGEEEPAGTSSKRPLTANDMRHVLAEILQQLRQLNREPSKHELSATKILGGLFQVVSWGLFAKSMVAFYDKIDVQPLIWGVASVFMQLASLSFFLMHRQD